MEQLDSLTVSSRSFYETAKLKVAASLIFGGACMFLLGMLAQNGGLSNAYNLILTSNLNLSDDEYFQALASGYGFAAFAYSLGFVLCLAIAIYISTLITG